MCREKLARLDQFIGMKCEVSFNFHNSSDFMGTYVYNSFNYELKENELYLFDNNDETLNTKIDIVLFGEIHNLSDDLYHDVVSIFTNEFIVSVTTLEQKPIFPICNKCGCEIRMPEESIYDIHGIPQFSSHYENQDDELHRLKFCDECIFGFVGEIETTDSFYM